jgi:hypothetical protein
MPAQAAGDPRRRLLLIAVLQLALHVSVPKQATAHLRA